MNYKIEVCVESVEEAIDAERDGADYLEICSRLDLDGLTPDVETCLAIRRDVTLPLKIMIRCRGGDFNYSKHELDEMRNSVQIFKKAGFTHFVFGACTPDHQIDLIALDKIVKIAGDDCKICFHKAIDATNNILEQLQALTNFPLVCQVLTSGGKPTALEGRDVIQKMIQFAPKGVEIIAAGKITADNLREINERIGAGIYHGRRILSPVKS